MGRCHRGRSCKKRTLENMKRVVILGRGASGKSTLGASLGEITGLRVIELDKVFWRPGLVATPRDQWVAVQESFVAEDGWTMDGDLGPYEVVEVRLRAADTIIFWDFSFARCAWRTIRRPRAAEFWRWVVNYRWQSRPILMLCNRSRNTRPIRTFTYFGTLRHSVSSSRNSLSIGPP